MQTQKITRVFLAVLMTVFAISAGTLFADDEEVAVPAVSDLAGIGIPQANLPASQEGLSREPYAGEFRLLDLNHDMKFNDFDIRQFQSIIDSLEAQDSTGLQIASRFRFAQKNQQESFPELYDLDQDGIFSEQDVTSLTNVINEFDQGASSGEEIIGRFRMRLTPHENENE